MQQKKVVAEELLEAFHNSYFDIVGYQAGYTSIILKMYNNLYFLNVSMLYFQQELLF